MFFFFFKQKTAYEIVCGDWSSDVCSSDLLLRDVTGVARCERIVYVDHVLGLGKELFEAVRQIGAEGIVSKRRGSLYRGGESREWLKTKCSEMGAFAITGFSELGDGKLDAIYVAEARDGVLCPAGQVRSASQGRGFGACSTSDGLG